MSDSDEVEVSISGYNIKKNGVKCELKEARDFYLKSFLQTQLDIVKSIGYAADNFSQKIPLNKIKASELELILNDCDAMSEYFLKFKSITKFLWDVYKNPKEYDAWCGSVDENIIYVIKKKNKKVALDITDRMFV